MSSCSRACAHCQVALRMCSCDVVQCPSVKLLSDVFFCRHSAVNAVAHALDAVEPEHKALAADAAKMILEQILDSLNDLPWVRIKSWTPLGTSDF